MSTNLLAQTNDVYLCSRGFQLKFIDVAYLELFALSKQLDKFFYSIGEVREDDFWKVRRKLLRRLSFHFVGIPLGNSILQSELSAAINYVEADIGHCEHLYPTFLPGYKTILEEMKKLAPTQLDTLKCQTDGLIQSLEGSTAILIKDTRFIPVVEKTYTSAGHKVVSINSLRSNTTYGNLIVVGPTKWYPDFVFSSPRAANVAVIKFRWIKDFWESRKVFPASIVSTKNNTVAGTGASSNKIEDSIDPELFLPTIDFSSVINGARERTEEGSDTELVEAIIAQLESDQIVFLDFDDSSTIRIIDIEDDDKPVKKIRVKDLAPEMYLLLKTSGGGDYIVPLADRILGSRSIELRQSQQHWKNLLRDTKNVLGTDAVVDELLARGCNIANQSNLRNWLSYRSIKTSKYSDFKAIMHLVGLADQAEMIWSQMRLITRAHIQAGRHITNLLLEIARESDLSDLMRLGIMEFELSDRDAGSITAYRIKALSDRNNTVFVSPTKIGTPLDIE